MKVITEYLKVNTKGDGDYQDITSYIEEYLDKTGLKEGNVTVFVGGSTAGITSFEFEPGLYKDIRDLFENLAPGRKGYQHDLTWGDKNGFSHLRSALCRPTYTIPFSKGKLLLGRWQQIVVLEFDNRPRKREVVFQFIGKRE